MTTFDYEHRLNNMFLNELYEYCMYIHPPITGHKRACSRDRTSLVVDRLRPNHHERYNTICHFCKSYEQRLCFSLGTKFISPHLTKSPIILLRKISSKAYSIRQLFFDLNYFSMAVNLPLLGKNADLSYRKLFHRRGKGGKTIL